MTTEKDFLADLERLSGVTPEKLFSFRVDNLDAYRLIIYESRDSRDSWYCKLHSLRQVLYTVVPSHHIVRGRWWPHEIANISDEAVAFLNTHAETIANLTMIAYNDEQHTSTHLT